MNSLDSPIPITEEWLKSVGFRWDEWERSGGKHWTLWFGGANDDSITAAEDVGIELAEGVREQWGWSCWLRSDFSHKYGRFIHLRHVFTRQDVIDIVQACSGVPWNPANHLYGAIRPKRQAEYLRESEGRLDRAIMKTANWAEHEKDESQARPRDSDH